MEEESNAVRESKLWRSTESPMHSAEYSETHSQEETINSGARAAEKEQGEQTSETPQGWKQFDFQIVGWKDFLTDR